MKSPNILKEEDLYNLILYSIFKIREDPEYSVISELIYILGKDGLLNLCSSLGGCTIKIPTILELKVFTNALLIYYYSITENKSFNESFKKLEIDPNLRKDIIEVYKKVVDIANGYNKKFN